MQSQTLASQASSSVSSHKQTLELAIKQAGILMMLGQFSSAAAALQVLDTLPNPPYTAYLLRGQAYEFSKQLEKSYDDCTRALKLKPKNIEILTRRSAILKKLNRLDEHQSDLALALQYRKEKKVFLKEKEKIYGEELLSHLENKKLLSEKQKEVLRKGTIGQLTEFTCDGDELLTDGLVGDAIDSFEKALKLFELDFIARTHRGHVYFKTKDLDSALEDANEALTQSNYCEAYLLRGKIHLQQDNHQAAKLDFIQFIIQVVSLSSVEVELEQQTTILRLINDVTETDASSELSLQAYIEKIKQQIEAQDLSAALVTLNQAISFHLFATELYALKGQVYLLLKNDQAALLYYSAAIWTTNDKTLRHQYYETRKQFNLKLKPEEKLVVTIPPPNFKNPDKRVKPSNQFPMQPPRKKMAPPSRIHSEEPETAPALSFSELIKRDKLAKEEKAKQDEVQRNQKRAAKASQVKAEKIVLTNNIEASLDEKNVPQTSPMQSSTPLVDNGETDSESSEATTPKSATSPEPFEDGDDAKEPTHPVAQATPSPMQSSTSSQTLFKTASNSKNIKVILDPTELFVLQRLSQYGLATTIGCSLVDRILQVSPNKIDNINIVTNVPPEKIKIIFSDLNPYRFIADPYVNNLFKYLVFENDTLKFTIEIFFNPDFEADKTKLLQQCPFKIETLTLTNTTFDNATQVVEVDDPLNALAEIQNHRLTCTQSSPQTLFETAPIHMLRAIPKMTKYNLEFAEKEATAFSHCKDLLGKIPPAVINSLMRRKIFKLGFASENFRKLAEHDLLKIFFSSIHTFLQQEFQGLCNEFKLIDQTFPAGELHQNSIESQNLLLATIYTHFVVVAMKARNQHTHEAVKETVQNCPYMKANLQMRHDAISLYDAIAARHDVPKSSVLRMG